jgi:microcystin degradation protein MlrC
MHESNTFAGRTTLADFERNQLLTGPAVREQLAGTHHEVGGFFEQLPHEDIEPVPVFAAWALPSGVIDQTAAEELTRRLTDALQSVGRLDGMLIAAHGAAVAAREPDFDGCWLTRLRRLVGPRLPLIGTLDLHANLSARMVAAANALVSYRSNPHLDQRDRGREAAALMARTLRGEIRPTVAAAFPPLVANIEAQATAESPCRELIAAADALRGWPKVLSVSLNLGFPYADVEEMGVSVIVVTDNDSGLASRCAVELAAIWWSRREDFRGRLVAPAEAVRRAAHSPAPVCLLDMGDNVGGGSPADGTVLAHELRAQGVAPAFVCLQDPEAVRTAAGAGIGTTVPLSVGGKTDDRHGPPLAAMFAVRGLFDGTFEETQARHGGIKRFDQGPTAVVETADGLTVLLTSRRTPPFSLRQVTAFGLDPARFRVLVVKGVHAPVAAYAPVCPTLLRVNTPGVTSADLSHLVYHHRRRPLFPFEPDARLAPADG